MGYYFTDYTSYDTTLSHHGVKGMKWGRRKARADAKEYLTARQYYGEGAGTRRKHIKEKVNYRKAHDSVYAKEFDSYVNNADLSKYVDKANHQRHSTDAKNLAKKKTRQFSRGLASAVGQASLAAVAGYATYSYLTNPNAQRTVNRYARMGINKVKGQANKIRQNVKFRRMMRNIHINI